MALSAFDDPALPPAPADLRRRLGGSAPSWTDLVAHVASTCPTIEEAWTFSGAKFGWSLRLKRGERVLVYLTPQDGRFLAGFVLGEKAVAAAAENGLPPAVLALLDAAPRYAEGRGIRVTVGSGGDLSTVRHLVALKVEAPSKGPQRAASRRPPVGGAKPEPAKPRRKAGPRP